MPKRKKDLSDKLSEADSFLDTGNFSDRDIDEMALRYHPNFTTIKSIKDLKVSSIPYAKYFSILLKKIRDPSLNKSERKFFIQRILAIALSQNNKRRLKETEIRLAMSRWEVRNLTAMVAEEIPLGVSNRERVEFHLKKMAELSKHVVALDVDAEEKGAPRKSLRRRALAKVESLRRATADAAAHLPDAGRTGGHRERRGV